MDLAFKANWPLRLIKAKKGQNSVLSPANDWFRQGEAELRASEHGIVYLYLAFEANGPLRLIKAKKDRCSVSSPANNCLRRGEADLRISKPG